MIKKTMLALTTALLLISAAASIPQTGFLENDKEFSVDGVELTQDEPRRKGLGDVLNQLLFSFTGVQDTYEPGESLDIALETTAQQTYDSEGVVKVVKLYKCADTTCDTPPPIQDPTDDSCGAEEFWPEYDDCIVRKADEIPFSITQEEGSQWIWNVEMNGLEDESTYILQGYFYDDSDGWEIVTDISEKKFRVESSQPEEPNIEITQSTDVNVRGDTIETTSYIQNTGGDMQEEWLIEMQPVQVSEAGFFDRFLSTVSTQQSACDPDNPQNVHKTYQLDSGEQATIQLESTDLKGGNYDVKMVSATGCTTTESDVRSTGPYGWSSVVDNVDIAPDVPQIVEYREPTLQVDNSTGGVTGTVYLENVGDAAMPTEFIVEMQLRTRSGDLLSFVGEQAACDPDSPENVHKPFKLDVGEREAISLESQVPSSGVYDVRFVTATECMVDGEGFFVEPYKSTDGAGFDDVAVTTSESETGEPGQDGDGLGIGSLAAIVVGLIALVGGVFILSG